MVANSTTSFRYQDKPNADSARFPLDAIQGKLRADYLLCAVVLPNASGKGRREDRNDCAEFEPTVYKRGFRSWQGRLDRLPGGAAEQVLPGGEQAEESRSGLGAELRADCCDVQLVGCGHLREVPPQRSEEHT